jgi:hypothetical protein
MTPGEAFLSKHDRRRFDPRLKAWAVVAILFAIAALGIVFANGPFSQSLTTAAAESPGKNVYVTSSTRPPIADETDRLGSGGGLSALWEVN